METARKLAFRWPRCLRQLELIAALLLIGGVLPALLLTEQGHRPALAVEAEGVSSVLPASRPSLTPATLPRTKARLPVDGKRPIPVGLVWTVRFAIDAHPTFTPTVGDNLRYPSDLFLRPCPTGPPAAVHRFASA